MWFRRGVAVVAVAAVAPVLAACQPAFDPVFVNFGPQGSAAATGPAPGATTSVTYTTDHGAAFDGTRGWVGQNDSTPVSIAGNARERHAEGDQRLDTFIHMQYTGSAPGSVAIPARWEHALASGTYLVNVSVGDPNGTDSLHHLRVEGAVAVDHFQPTTAERFRQASVKVQVTDGRLTVDAAGGTNTKLDFVSIQGIGATTPFIKAVEGPLDGVRGVSRTTSISLNPSTPVSVASLAEGVKLFGPDGEIEGNKNSDAAGGTISFTPKGALVANTRYTVVTTPNLKDTEGNPFQVMSSTFTTGATGTVTSPHTFSDPEPFAAVDMPTATVFGPDGKLYVGTYDGRIVRYTLGANGKVASGTTPQTISTLAGRTIIGLRFDPGATAGSLKLWVSHNFEGDATYGTDPPPYSGIVSSLSGPNLATRADVITGLPRSLHDHMTNGIDFGPDGRLYVGQGATTGWGDVDAYWGPRPETPLSTAILVADVNHPSFPATVNVNTSAGYDPDTGPVKVFATGVRNAYSVVWANGHLYAPVNESANGNAPGAPDGSFPPLKNVPPGNDYFARILPPNNGVPYYYGHPNPSIGQYVANGGNPTSGVDPWELSQYPVGTQPASNWAHKVSPLLDLGEHRSPNGSAVYTADSFNGALNGKVIVAEYSNGDDLIVIDTDADGDPTDFAQLASGFDNPIAVAVHPQSGRLYVAELPELGGGGIQVLSPDVPPAPVANAGPDVTVASSGTVEVDGSGSRDPSGGTLSYAWTQLGGPAAVIDDRSKAKPKVTAPKGPATLTFRVTVTGTGGLTDTDDVVVTVQAPK